MARELAIDVVMRTTEAETALARLETQFMKAGDSIEEASKKVEKFEKSYRDNAAKTEAKRALDGLAKSTQDVGAAADKTTPKLSAQERATDALRATVLRYASAAVVGAAIKSTLDWAGNLTDLSKATGISTTSLQKFEMIGKGAGVSMQSMADMALQMSNRLAGNDRSASAALDKMGLSTARLLALKPDEMMLEFARALSKVENPQQRVALAMDVLGRSGKNLLPVLDDLNAKWDSTNAKLGEDGVARLDAAGDALDELTSAGKGLIANFLAPFAPLLNGIAAALNPVGKLFGAFLRDVLSPLDLNKWREWKDNLVDAARSMQYISGVGPGIMAPPPPMPNAPPNPFLRDSGLGSTAPVPGSPQFAAIERDLTARIRAGLTGGVGRSTAPGLTLPSLAGGNAAVDLFRFANQPGGLGNFRLPFMTGTAPIAAGGSPISFLNGMQLPGTVPMNAPGVGGGGGLRGFLGQNGTQIAGLGLQLASRFVNPNSRAGGALNGAMQGAGMGAMFGPWGMAIGGGLGLLGGLFGGGRAQRNQRNAELGEMARIHGTEEFKALQKEAERFGVTLDKVAGARNMREFQAATEEATKKLSEMADVQAEIDRLTEASTVTFDKMNAVVQEFGLDVSKIGPAFQQAKIDKEAQRIIDAMALMEKGGADMNGVLEGMQDEISKVVQDSLKFGTTIPENMKPWIQKLKDSGKLVDENGNKIEDISGLKFGAPMASEMDKVVKKLDELIAKLKEMVDGFNDASRAAGGLPGSLPTPGGGSGDGGGGGDTPGFATGGVAGRDFRRPGHGDIFPALLRRGERVLPAGSHGGGVSVTINGMSVGSFDSRGDAVDQIGESVVRYLERRGARLVA